MTEIEYGKVVKYIQQKLLANPMLKVMVSGTDDEMNEIEAIPKFMVEELQTLAPYTSYKESQKGKRVKKPVEGKYIEEWNKFWNTWPSTKSVPDTQIRSGAPMKKNETEMYKKWLNAVENSPISIDSMQYAAESYLQWGYEDSKRLGRNELLSRNGMEPWLNQKVYLTYMEVPKPKQYQKVEDQLAI